MADRTENKLFNSEVVTFRIDPGQQQQIANFMKCKVGKLLMIYLGLPISDKHLGAKAFTAMETKMRSKLSNWKGKMLSAGGGNDSYQFNSE